MVRILTILNVDDAPPGLVGDHLAARGAECVRINPHTGDKLPETPDSFDGILILGGPQSVADPAFDPVFEPLARLVRAFHEEEKPVLGLCLGSQLLARAFGQKVRHHNQLQFGFKQIDLTDAAASDPVLSGLDHPQTAFVHHYDTYSLPEDAVLLMTEADTPCHAFRVGHTTYAFQSHPEATADIIRGWVARTQDGVRRHLGKRGEELLAGLDDACAEELPKAAGFAETIALRWLDLVEGRAASGNAAKPNQ
ncbi:type 1 glutamine amidotransferase [Rhodobacteraceae bacterium HSP-20]|uniref:Type 1 glutamine amidotransferase n=1 Tax=Paragemmobacter amnigenus TaxID=2852097 RepID=A0ABS6JCA7_9RHOB|nr:type 1 glutamine amidotransferase [Rhodobacter amnigenus]MBU9700107.1 type 1 glutamine amidotransferase [Rhodobacter amnigenus]MBV4391334.1 type 1 glutamine amidotransferase [Rhodobacter amnigenus]